MKKSNAAAVGALITAFIGLVILSFLIIPSNYITPNADILLLGEQHGTKKYYETELKQWKDCYESKGMRHLFLELPYYDGEFLNIWINSDNDEILDKMLEEIKGTASDTPDYRDFFLEIKKNCPETVFHCTDIGHQYKTTGARYLEYLESIGENDSEKYRLAEENIEQAKEFYGADGELSVREPFMISNFIREYDSIGKPQIMGIYGGYHINANEPDLMAGALREHYNGKISCISLKTAVFRSWKALPEWGISVTGIVFLLMLFIPNIIWSKNQPAGYEESAKRESKLLLALERAGEVLVSVLVLTDRRLDRLWLSSASGPVISPRLGYLVLALILMIMYEFYWIKYFRSSRTLGDMYADYCGFPLAGASLPVFAVFLLGVFACNAFLTAASIILGIGHIGIHLMHKKEIEK